MGLGFRDFRERRDTFLELPSALLIRCECFVLEEELHRAFADAVEARHDLGLELVDAREVHVAHLAKRDEMAARVPELAETFDVLVDRRPRIREDRAEDVLDLLLRRLECLARFRPQLLDFLELVDDALRGLVNVGQRPSQIADLGVVEPVVGIDDFPRRRDEIFVRLAAGLLLVDHTADPETVRDPAHEVRIADFLEKRARRRASSGRTRRS